MTLVIRPIRLGRIHRPKYNIVVYKNFRPVDKVAILHPFPDLLLVNIRVRVIQIYFDKLDFWISQGLRIPYWLDVLIRPLSIHSRYSGTRIPRDINMHKEMIYGSRLTPLYKRNFISGKAHYRIWSRNFRKQQ